MFASPFDDVGEERSDRYLITYADLITLLLGLFIVLYSVSQIDVTKYRQMVGVFENVFGGKVYGSGTGTSFIPLPADVAAKDLASLLKEAIGNRTLGNDVTFSQSERGITIHMLERLLFTSGSADLKLSSYTVLDTIASVLHRLPNDFRVEGHTDDVPIATQQFPSNWHLSVSRAVNTAYYLITKHRLNADKIAVVGYAEYKPMVKNDSNENRAKNRRVDIVILDMAENKQASKE